MVVQVIVYIILCVVVFLRLSNRCVTVFCVVSHYWSGYCDACQCLCLFFMLVHLLWIWAWLWILLLFVLEFFTIVFWGRVCRFHFNMLVLMFQYYFVLFVVVVIVSRCCHCWLCINICWRRARYFASRFKFAMPEKSRARAGDLLFGCWRFICCIRLVQFGSSCSPWLWFCSFSLCFFGSV